jgi:hypothetical protein
MFLLRQRISVFLREHLPSQTPSFHTQHQGTQSVNGVHATPRLVESHTKLIGVALQMPYREPVKCTVKASLDHRPHRSIDLLHNPFMPFQR